MIPNPTINNKPLTDLAFAFAANTLDDRESLTEFSAGSRISPPVLMEKAVSRLDPQVTHSINHVLMAIYIGHYLSVVNRMSKVGNVTAESMLSPLGGDSKFTERDMLRGELGVESNIDIHALWNENKLDMLAPFENVEASMESNFDFSKPASLVAGRTFEVPLINGEKTIKIPVTITISPRITEKSGVIDVVAAFLSKDNSYIGRYHRYMAGEFSSFAEYALGLDLVEEDFKLLINDKEGLYEFAKIKSKRGLLSSFLTGKKQMNVASAMMVVMKETASEIETAMRGKLTRERDRQKFFKLTGSMILCVVDPNRELVRIYQRGIDQYGDYTYDDLKPAATNTNAFDINAVMRAMQAGDPFSMR